MSNTEDLRRAVHDLRKACRLVLETDGLVLTDEVGYALEYVLEITKEHDTE